MRFSRYAGTCNKTLQRGFTLAETMIVLVIAGMMVTLAIPRVDVTRYKADAIAQIVRTQIQNASRSAITRQHDVIVSFDTLGQQMVTAFDANNNGVVDAGERVSYRGLDTGVLFADPSVNGISGSAINSSISGASITMVGGMPSLIFHRDGSVSSDAEIYVSIAARGPKMYRGLSLTQATGRVDWYRLNTSTNKWVLAGL